MNKRKPGFKGRNGYIESLKASKKVETKKRGVDVNRPVRIGIVLFGFMAIFVVLIISFAVTQIINGDRLREMAINQQLTKKSIAAKRGDILDRNGEVLAQSIEVDTVTVNPSLLRTGKGKEVDKDEMAQAMSNIFGIDKQELLNQLNSDQSVITVARKVEKDKIELLKTWQKDKNVTSGINIDKDIKRYYPYEEVASNIIGFMGVDNNGLEGIEKKLDGVLKGKEGRIVSQSDVYRNFTKENPEQLIKAEDGKNVYLTIDIKLQATVSKYLKEAVKENKARDGIAVVMSPKTGEILAMVNEPTYNSNDPFAPVGMSKEAWDKLDKKTQSNLRYSIWKNKAVTDPYEPGSTFKIITSAMGLEEAKTSSDKAGDFLCTGSQKVYDWDIKCWRSYNPHGHLSLRGALENSCNPAFIQLSQRIGREVFFQYLKGFGLTNKTGIELLGEASPILYDEKKAGPVEMATLSFGQRFKITPIQLISSVAGIVNDGNMIKPNIVLKEEDRETGNQEERKKEHIRQVVSKETSQSIRNMLRTVVSNGTGKNAEVKGFNVGGKSGTSEPDYSDKNGIYIASFVGIAPAEDPEYIVLVVIRDPKGKSRQGGQVAAPVVSHILKEILVNSKLVATGQKTQTVEKEISVPELVGKTVEESEKITSDKGIKLVYGNVKNKKSLITKQVPRAGTSVYQDARLYVDTEENSNIKEIKVPSLSKKTYEEAKKILRDLGLNINADSKKGVVMIQDPVENITMETGNVVKLTIKEEVVEGH